MHRTSSTIDIDVGVHKFVKPKHNINSYPDENENCMKYFEPTNLVDGETTTGRVGLIICAIPLHKMHGLVPMCKLMIPLYLQEEGIIAPSYLRRSSYLVCQGCR
jgi:hypothetical protein